MQFKTYELLISRIFHLLCFGLQLGNKLQKEKPQVKEMIVYQGSAPSLFQYLLNTHLW